MSGQVQEYHPIAISSESTVVAEYTPDAHGATAYQSEADLERELIRLLASQAYEVLTITSEAQLVANLRAQLEVLNGITFSDAEWAQFFAQRIAGANDGIVEKTVRIHDDHVPVAHPRRWLDEERHAHRQGQHPQQSAAGDQSIRGPSRRGRRRPLESL